MIDKELDQQTDQMLSDEEKMLMEEYVISAYDLIYDPGEDVINLAARKGGSKVDNAAQAGFLVGKKIDASRESEGKPPYPDAVKLMGGHQIVSKIIEYAEGKGVKPFSDEEKSATLEKSYQTYMQDGIKNRTIDPIALANGVEQAQPGAIKKAMAGIPDTPQGTPGAAPAEPQQQPQQQGALGSMKSPLEGYI